MKNTILFLLIFIPFLGVSQSFRTGVKFGGNLSTLGTRDANADANTMRSGYHVGWIGSFDVSTFSLQTELIYSTQGGGISIGGLKYEEVYNYLNIPIALKFAMGSDFSFHFGPYFSILMNATQKETGQPDVDIDEFIASTDYGGFAGIGYDLQDSWLFEIRYNYGFTDVEIRDNVERRNRFLQLSISYFIKK